MEHLKGDSLRYALTLPAKDKHSSLLRKSVNYGRKKFYSTDPRSECHCLPLPAFACLCLPLPAFACLCLPLLAFACLCLPLPAFACLCLPLPASLSTCVVGAIVVLAIGTAPSHQGLCYKTLWVCNVLVMANYVVRYILIAIFSHFHRL